MKFKDNIPIYLQIQGYLYRQIALGKLKAGDQLPSVRNLAAELTVNVNTVQRALSNMNMQGILFTKRGEGNFVTTDTKLLQKTKQTLIANELEHFVHSMTTLGINQEDLPKTVKEYLQKKEQKNG